MPIRRLGALAAAGLLLLAVCGCPSKPSAPPAAPPKPTTDGTAAALPAPTADLWRSAHAALGHLESERFPQAEAELLKILSQRPADPFASRNLAICRLLIVEQIPAARDQAAFDAARRKAADAVAQLLKIDPQSAAAHILQSRLAKKSGDQTAAIAALRRAVELEPDYAPAWFELYFTLSRESLDPERWANSETREPILAAGRKVDALQPDNWFFLNYWVRDLAAAKASDELRTVLERLRPQVDVFAPIIERDTRANPQKLLDAVLTSLKPDSQQIAIGPLNALCNIFFLPEAPYDKRRLDVHLLELVRTDLDARDPGSGTTAEAIPVRFTPVDEKMPELPGGAARDMAWADVDLDGRFDLLVLTETQLVALVRKEGDLGWQIGYAVEVGEGYHRLLVADLDDDAEAVPAKSADGAPIAAHPFADPDFVLTGPAGALVIENQKPEDGTRTFVPHRDNVPWSDVRDVTASLLVDLDHDGDLDLFTATAQGVRLWSQRGNFQFLEITNRSLLPPGDVAITAAAAVDWDRDTDIDLLVSSRAGLRMLENLRHGRFRDRPLEGELDELPMANALRVGDFDGDGGWDVAAAGENGVTVAFMQRPLTGSGTPTLRRLTTIADQPATRLSTWDYDNDGLADLVAASPTSVHAFRQSVPGRFAPLTDALPADGGSFALPADIDGDGDLDLWTGGIPVLWRNDGGNGNHWIDVRVWAMQDKGGATSDSRRANHQGIGSLLELRFGARYQAAVIDGQSTHFGLGTSTRADLLRILWTNGIPNSFVDPAVDTWVYEEQLPIGSCPFLYTWDGERFVFCTDLLWNAPLGLKFTEDVVAPWREWEYLKIDGEKLQPRDGRYELQITEELWEVAYFDQVKLFAVDHPADVQVFTNEKVGPAELAMPLIHTVRTPRRPVAARDTQGRDILELVSAADGHYAKTFDRKLASGLTSDHFLELDFGNLREAKRITLFLTGWMYPTDTSLRVQLSQHPTLPLPKPPALWTPDAQGEWREVRPFMGFIGGKPKTIAVDVTAAFAPRLPKPSETSEVCRLRISTNMEFYWDEAFVTVDEAPQAFPGEPGASAPGVFSSFVRTNTPGADAPGSPELRITELTLDSADLHFRGYSQAVHRPGYGPENYDYDRVSREPRWPPLTGGYTRYGDVRPLLLARDDELAVFGAGDEMTLKFAEPPEPLPTGWVRDFVLYNVGWDKDAAMHTVYGQSVEPLPFEAMAAYGNGEERPSNDAYDRYLRTYQSRQQNPASFWNFVRQTTTPEAAVPRSRFEPAGN